MNYYGDSMNKLIEQLTNLPGIGAKMAQRIAFHIINMKESEAEDLANTIFSVGKNIKYCQVCCNLAEDDTCAICSNPKRDRNVIMVVEDPRDMSAYEKTKQFKGVYHILHGAISPSDGITPNHIRIKELMTRMGDDVTELILATNATAEGEGTAMYISRLVKPMGIKVTRIANGVPVGGSLEYVDDVTLSRALECRFEV